MKSSLFRHSFTGLAALLLAAGPLPIFAQDKPPAAAGEEAAPAPASPSATVGADSTAQAARELLEEYKGALVVVTVLGDIVTQTDGPDLPSRPQERRTLGVTIADNGLVVVSNSAIDASVGLEQQRARMEDDKIVTILQASTEFKSVKLSYGDTNVIEGTVIRQEPDADLAFILPKQETVKQLEKKFEIVDFSKFSASAALTGDEVVGLSRASMAYSYMPTVIVGRVTGVYASGSRTFYVTTAGTAQGVPIFATNGKPVGVTVERIINGRRSGILGTVAGSTVHVLGNLAMDTYKQTGAPSSAPATKPEPGTEDTVAPDSDTTTSGAAGGTGEVPAQ